MTRPFYNSIFKWYISGFACLLLILQTSCKKEKAPELITYVSAMTHTSMSIGGVITCEGSSPISERGVCWGLLHNPDLNDNKIIDNSREQIYVTTVPELSNNTNYFVRAYVTNKEGTFYGNEISVTLYLNQPGPQLIDIDGNQYNTVKIGSQTWMAENLKVKHLNNGDTIELRDSNHLCSPGYTSNDGPPACLNDKNPNYILLYGRMYNFSAVNTRKLCPKGWHVPEPKDWETLINYLGGSDSAGGKMKTTGTTYWNPPNTGADNSSGFSGMPGGEIHGALGCWFAQYKMAGCWWCYDNLNPNSLYGYLISYNSKKISLCVTRNHDGASLSCRCVED